MPEICVASRGSPHDAILMNVTFCLILNLFDKEFVITEAFLPDLFT
jgi:hypothetical protein